MNISFLVKNNNKIINIQCKCFFPKINKQHLISDLDTLNNNNNNNLVKNNDNQCKCFFQNGNLSLGFSNFLKTFPSST